MSAHLLRSQQPAIPMISAAPITTRYLNLAVIPAVLLIIYNPAGRTECEQSHKGQ
jgi:hypothetical protein